jgi:hypothetical protein
MHKTILTVALAAITQLSYGQLSIDAGITTNAPYTTLKLAYEQNFRNPLNVEVGVRTDFRSIIPSVTGGLELPTCRGAVKFMAGGYYHLVPGTKESPSTYTPYFGGAVRLEVNQGTVGLEWNGQFVSLTVGFIFRRRE